MEAAAGGMSAGKRNHEELSDTMALVEAACKVPPNNARPCAYSQPDIRVMPLAIIPSRGTV